MGCICEYAVVDFLNGWVATCGSFCAFEGVYWGLESSTEAWASERVDDVRENAVGNDDRFFFETGRGRSERNESEFRIILEDAFEYGPGVETGDPVKLGVVEALGEA